MKLGLDEQTTRLVEDFTRTSPFGVRFWDVVARDVVRSGLAVRVLEVGNPHRRINAFSNASGVWILRDLQLRDGDGNDFEFGDGRQQFWDRWPQPVRNYVFTVRDEERRPRFQPFQFLCGAPQRGFARCGCGLAHSPVDPSVPDDAVPIYPSASRTAPAGTAVVRAQLE